MCLLPFTGQGQMHTSLLSTIRLFHRQCDLLQREYFKMPSCRTLVVLYGLLFSWPLYGGPPWQETEWWRWNWSGKGGFGKGKPNLDVAAVHFLSKWNVCERLFVDTKQTCMRERQYSSGWRTMTRRRMSAIGVGVATPYDEYRSNTRVTNLTNLRGRFRCEMRVRYDFVL